MLYLGNSHLVRDAISLDYADSIAKELIAILGLEFLDVKRITTSVLIHIIIYVYRVVLDVAEIDGVLADGLDGDGPRCATATKNQERKS